MSRGPADARAAQHAQHPDARATWPAPRAVIFDLDGTLTQPLLDFDAMRAEIGLAPGLPILEQLADGDDALRARGERVLRRHERDAIARATLADGCVELLALLRARGLPAAILTRNTREVVDLFVRKFDLGRSFSAGYTREDGPPKPSPEGVFRLCHELAVAPADTLVVGDYKFDVLAGRSAGCRTALVTAEEITDLADWGSPDYLVRSLRELLPIWS